MDFKMLKNCIKCILTRFNHFRQSRKIKELSENVSFGMKSKVFVRSNSKILIKKNSTVHGVLYVEEHATLQIGESSTIRFNTEINCAKYIRIGNNVIISNNVFISDNDSHPVTPEDRLKMTSGDHEGELWRNKYAKKAAVVIEDNVWIGQNAVVLKGTKIGEGSIVAACSVVTKDIPPYSLAYGNPARIVKGKYLAR